MSVGRNLAGIIPPLRHAGRASPWLPRDPHLNTARAAIRHFTESWAMRPNILLDSPIDPTFHLCYIPSVEWEVEFTGEFERWWSSLTEEEQEDINAKVILLQSYGPALRRPHSDAVASSRHAHMKELRIQHAGRPYRVLYAFDPRRRAILLIGGDKTGNDRWYEEFVPVADRLYKQHLATLKKESETHG
jgi:hypothetical protein